MEFWASVNVLRRRWYVFLPCLVGFGVLAAVVLAGVKPSYQATGKVIFIQPDQAGVANADKVNPVSDLSGGAAFANLLSQDLLTDSFKDGVIKAGASADYTVAPPFASNPFVVLTVTGPTPQATQQSYATIYRLLSEDAAKLQQESSAPKNTYFVPLQVAKPGGATKIIGARIKALIVVGAVGLIVSLGLTFLVDSILSARARRKADRHVPISTLTVETGAGPFRLLDQLSSPDFGMAEPGLPPPDEIADTADTGEPVRPGRATGY